MKKQILLTGLLMVSACVLHAQNTKLAQAKYEEGIKILQSGDRERAIPLFKKALDADSTHKNSLYNLSVLLLDAGDAPLAIPYANTLVRKYPDFPKVFALRGRIKLASGDFSGAFTDFETQNKIAPSSEAYSGLGAISMHAKDYPGAEAFFSKAIDLFPESANAHNDRGIARILLNKDNEALSDLRHASLLSPFEGLILQNFALAYEKTGALLPASNLLKESADKEGTAVSSLNMLGILELNRGFPETAIKHFEKAIEIEPDFVPSLINAGAAYLMADDISKAKKYHDLALKIESDNVEALFNRGVIYYLENEEQKACQNWLKASENSPKAFTFHQIYCTEN